MFPNRYLPRQNTPWVSNGYRRFGAKITIWPSSRRTRRASAIVWRSSSTCSITSLNTTTSNDESAKGRCSPLAARRIDRNPASELISRSALLATPGPPASDQAAKRSGQVLLSAEIGHAAPGQVFTDRGHGQGDGAAHHAHDEGAGVVVPAVREVG